MIQDYEKFYNLTRLGPVKCVNMNIKEIINIVAKYMQTGNLDRSKLETLINEINGHLAYMQKTANAKSNLVLTWHGKQVLYSEYPKEVVNYLNHIFSKLNLYI